MSERKLKITPGPWRVVMGGTCSGAWPELVGGNFGPIGRMETSHYEKTTDGFPSTYADHPERFSPFDNAETVIANAHLCAEAGTVANECGLMPRELLAQRDELLAVCYRQFEVLEAIWCNARLNDHQFELVSHAIATIQMAIAKCKGGEA